MRVSELIRGNFQLIMIMLAWLIVGAYLGSVHFIFITATLVLFNFKNLTADMLMGFIFILVLSDSLETGTSFAKSYKNIYIILLFLFFIADVNNRQVFVNYYLLFIPYFIMGLIGLYYSPAMGTSAQKLLSYVLLYIIVPNYVIGAYLKGGKYFFGDLIFFLFIIMAGGYVVMVIWPDVAISHGGRLRGVFGNPNGLGIFCILVYTLFFIVNQRFPDLFERKEKLFFVLFMLYVTISTGSRTALMAIMLFHMFHYLFKRSVFLGFFIFILVLMSVEFFILYFPKIIIALDLQKSFRLETLQEGSGRTIAWNFAWQNIQQSLLVGKGLAYDEYLMRTNFDFLSKEGHQGGVHNTYLIMWLNTGLIGLIFFLRGFFLLFYRASKHSSYAYPVMIAIMLSINFEPWLAASLNPYTILFLIIITVLSLDDWLVEKQKVTEIEDELSNEGITT